MSTKTWLLLGALAVLSGCSTSQRGSQRQVEGTDPNAPLRYNGTAVNIASSVDPGQPGGGSARSATSGMSNSPTYVPATPYSAEGAGLIGAGRVAEGPQQ